MTRARRTGPRLAALLTFLAINTGAVSAQDTMPSGFVYLRDVEPGIVQDIRYAGANNFTGHRLDGYDAPECILRREAALALKRVQADLETQGLGLKVYDCYRPHRAVRAMAQWAHDGRGDGGTKRFFPKQQKSTLFALGYLASLSRHSTGTAVDLSLVERAKRGEAPPFDPAARYGPCTGPAAARAPDDSVDMGTGYDCFDDISRTRSTGIAADAQQRRALLVAAMRRHGFSNYHREWWHFSLAVAPPPAHYDFPIRPRAASAQRR